MRCNKPSLIQALLIHARHRWKGLGAVLFYCLTCRIFQFYPQLNLAKSTALHCYSFFIFLFSYDKAEHASKKKDILNPHENPPVVIFCVWKKNTKCINHRMQTLFTWQLGLYEECQRLFLRHLLKDTSITHIWPLFINHVFQRASHLSKPKEQEAETTHTTLFIKKEKCMVSQQPLLLCVLVL